MKFQRFASLLFGTCILAAAGQALAAPNIVCRDDATGSEISTWVGEQTWTWCRVQDWDGAPMDGTYDLDCDTTDGFTDVVGGVVNSGNDHDFGAFCAYGAAVPNVVAEVDFYDNTATLVDSEQVLYAVDGAAPAKQTVVNQHIARGLKELYSRWVSGGEDGDFGSDVIRAGFNAVPFITKGTKPGKDATERNTVDATRIYGETVHTALAFIQRSAIINPIPDAVAWPNNAPGGDIEVDHGAKANGELLYFNNSGYAHPIIALGLLASDPTTVAWDGPVTGRPFHDIVQDALDGCYGAMKDGGSDRGGWRYGFRQYQGHDGSAIWCALAINEAALNYGDYDAATNPTGAVIPDWVKDELTIHDNTCATAANGGYSYGCGGSDPDLTPNLMQVHAIREIVATDPKVIDAVNVLDAAFPGNLFNNTPTTATVVDHYGAFTLAKGMRGARNPANPKARQVIDTLQPSGRDWYDDLSTALVNTDVAAGNGEIQWEGKDWENWLSGNSLSTGSMVEVLLRGLTDIPPVADANGPYTFLAGQPSPPDVILDGCGSFHQDQTRTIVDYAWDVDGDGTVDFNSNTCSQSFDGTAFYPDTGSDYNVAVSLTVTDNGASLGGSDLTDSDAATMMVLSGNPQVPPVADPGGPVYAGFINEPITFDGSGSTDANDPNGPCGSPLEYNWDVNGDGVSDSGWLNVPTFDFSFAAPVSANVTLQVRDDCGAIGTSTASVTVSIARIRPIFYHVRATRLISVYPNPSGGWGAIVEFDAAMSARNGGNATARNITLQLLNGPANWIAIPDDTVNLLPDPFPAPGLDAGGVIISDGPANASSTDKTFTFRVDTGVASNTNQTFFQITQEDDFGNVSTYQASWALPPAP